MWLNEIPTSDWMKKNTTKHGGLEELLNKECKTVASMKKRRIAAFTTGQCRFKAHLKKLSF